MIRYLPFQFWYSLRAVHQLMQCAQMLPFHPGVMVYLFGAVAQKTAVLN